MVTAIWSLLLSYIILIETCTKRHLLGQDMGDYVTFVCYFVNNGHFKFLNSISTCSWHCFSLAFIFFQNDASPKQIGKSCRLFRILHDPSVGVRRRQRPGSLRRALCGRPQNLRFQREEHRLGRLHRVVRSRNQEVPL